MSLLILSVACLIFSRGSFACFREDDLKFMTITTGSTYYQECQCEEPGYSIQHLMWLDKDDNVITEGPGTGSNIYLEYQDDSLNLHISEISKTMSGTYKCVTDFQGIRYTKRFQVEAYDPLYIYGASETQHLMEGSDSRINCEARGDTEPIVIWELANDIPMRIQTDDKYQVTPQGLIVKNVTVNDEGIYKCAASVLNTGEEVDRFIKVKVMTKPVIKQLNAIPEANVAEGYSLSIECLTDSKSEPEYVWSKISELMENNSTNKTWQQKGNTITFEEIAISDSGTYECTAKNNVGNATKQIEIFVLQQPKIIDFSDRTEVEGTNVTITCNATGQPAPNVTITTIRRDDDEDGEYAITIPFAPLTIDHTFQGMYICNATNEMGFDAKEMYLTVLHKPYFHKIVQTEWGWNGKTVNLSCAHKSNPPADILWRFQGNDIRTEEQVEINQSLLEMLSNAKYHFLPIIIDKNFSYGIYECKVKNELGETTKTITVKEGFVPPPITNANIVDLTPTSVLFSIEMAEKVNGPEVVGFTAEYDEAENYNITNIHINRTWAIGRPFKLEKLKPNVKYQVKFAAVNEVGTGPWSETWDFFTLEKSVPEAPVWDVDYVKNSTACNQVITWKSPEDNGEPIDYYVLRYCTANDEESSEKLCVEDQVESTTQIELHDLKCNTTYYLELVAHNSRGNSSAANISITTPPLAEEPLPFLSAEIIIGLAVVVVIVCLVLLDLILFAWKKQGIIASCCYKKNKNRKDFTLNSRDKKGLLRDNREQTDDSLKRPDKGHKEYEYNKTTGVITGKHSAV